MKKLVLTLLLFSLTACERYVTEISTLTLSGKYKLASLDVTSVDQNLSKDSLYGPGTVYINPRLPDPFDTIPINRFYIHLDYSTIRINQLGVSSFGQDLWQYGTAPNDIQYQVLNNNPYDLGYLKFTYFPPDTSSRTLIFHIERDGLESLQLQSTGQWAKGKFGEKQVLTFVWTRVGP